MAAPTSWPIERRSSPRVDVALSCYGSGSNRLVIARTVNISREGALLRWRTTAAGGAPKLGEPLIVDVALLASALAQRCIRCTGRVVRVQLAEGQEPLVALAISQMEFRDHADAERARSASWGSEEAGQ
jgi:hypothetical protein